MVAEAPGPINFTMFLGLFGDRLKGNYRNQCCCLKLYILVILHAEIAHMYSRYAGTQVCIHVRHNARRSSSTRRQRIIPLPRAHPTGCPPPSGGHPLPDPNPVGAYGTFGVSVSVPYARFPAIGNATQRNATQALTEFIKHYIKKFASIRPTTFFLNSTTVKKLIIRTKWHVTYWRVRIRSYFM